MFGLRGYEEGCHAVWVFRESAQLCEEKGHSSVVFSLALKTEIIKCTFKTQNGEVMNNETVE